jgi:hypothetical protein
MNIKFDRVGMRLAAREQLAIRDGQGLRIACRGGSVWITQDRDLDDVVLGAGECFTLDRPGLAILQTFKGADIALTAAPLRPHPAA